MDVHYFREVKISTRFGEPSCALVCGRVGGVSVCMLARHGVGHTLLPADVNYAANLAAMKVLSGSENIFARDNFKGVQRSDICAAFSPSF